MTNSLILTSIKFVQMVPCSNVPVSFDVLFLFVLPIEVVLLGFSSFSFSHPPRGGNPARFDIFSFTHPLRGGNIVRTKNFLTNPP